MGPLCLVKGGEIHFFLGWGGSYLFVCLCLWAPDPSKKRETHMVVKSLCHPLPNPELDDSFRVVMLLYLGCCFWGLFMIVLNQ